ncbi:putative filamentation induced by cAMP protein Fic [Candidatus Nitrososphaera gargensis Ga9.2]|uniref:Putative filamentation induced by cAMP protein Fic n=1 Tax=Nitrososphaera gargensis (strain Ga9.2) TaxID=1237085 RepID=K0IGW8_NITGG|nr:Fic family protein [Candidatus Nitrososphaera gargensis]AFU57057.1 putative filamentation induced by cAMP protein Fic [Candidatus Nitrososphaera gargensis Ga9.2]
MTMVTKRIKGISYYYFQDAVKRPNGQLKIVNTIVGRADLSEKELIKAQAVAFQKHLINMLKFSAIIKKPRAHFENKPTSVSEDELEYIKWLYQNIRKNISESDREEYEKTFLIRYVYGTTAIEGVTLNENETAKVLIEGLTPNNKPLEDAIAVSNYKDVKEFLKGFSGDITEHVIKHIHKLLMKGITGDDRKPIPIGEYRIRGALIRGFGYTPPPAETVPTRMRYLLDEYRRNIKKVHPVETAALFHQKFEEIHPFQDGNGRTGREILNLMLEREGFPPIYITPTERSRYLDALEAGNALNHVPLIDFIIERMNATVMYLFTKTSLYKLWESEEVVVMAAQEEGIPELFNIIKRMMDVLHKSKELP